MTSVRAVRASSSAIWAVTQSSRSSSPRSGCSRTTCVDVGIVSLLELLGHRGQELGELMVTRLERRFERRGAHGHPSRPGRVPRITRSRRRARRYAHAGGRLAQAQSLGGLGTRQVLEMPQEHDFAVVLAELFERGVKSLDELVADGFGRRRQPLVAQLRCQIKRRAIEKLARRRWAVRGRCCDEPATR